MTAVAAGHSPTAETPRIRRWSWLPWIIVLLLLGWAGYGIWPVGPVEGDEQGVLFGVKGMLQHDQLQLQLRYTYYLQPGYYQLLAGLSQLTGAEPETLFGLTTVIGALGFAVAGARLLEILTGWSLGWTLVVMLSSQEVTTAAFYMNTSALAGGIAVSAVILARRPQRSAWLGAGLLLALAGWLRADSLLIAPACLGLAYWQEKLWRPAIIRTTFIAAVSVAAFLALYALSGASLLASLAVYEQRGFLHSGWRILALIFPLLLSPLFALAALAGLGLLLAPARRALGVIMISGVTASLLAHGTELTTPKYFYYLIPFALLPALLFADQGFRASRAWTPGRRRAGAFFVAALLLADGALGLRTLPAEQRLFRPAPTPVTFAELTWHNKPYALVLGPGELVFNVDGFRLRTGRWFAPECWHREKQRVQTDLATIRSWFGGGQRDLTVYWSDWLPLQLATRELLASGFRLPEGHLRQPDKMAAAREDWSRDGRIVHLDYLGYADSTYQAPGPAPASTTGTDTYFIGDCANRPITELADDRHWQLLSAMPEGLITLHQRR